MDEQTASIIKTFLLEENQEIIRTYNSYISGYITELRLKANLIDLAEKLGSYFERPTSPFPRKDEMLKTINTLVRDKLQNED